MRSGYAPATVGVPVGTVTVDGVAREATAVSTVRELGGGGVPGVRASAAAEGSVSFAQLTNADSQPAPSPWARVGNFPPAPGSRVQVDAGTTAQVFPMLTGVVDAASAGSDGRVVTSVIDPIDRLHRKITIGPLLALMPALHPGGPGRRIGLSSDYIADLVMRSGGFYTTPYQPAAAVGVSVPGQGSMWPERGTCESAGQHTGQGAARFTSTEWGWGITNADASYSLPSGVTADAGFTLGLMVSPKHSAVGYVSATAGAGVFELRFDASRRPVARYNGTTVATLPVQSGATRVEVRVTSTSMTIRAEDGTTATGAHGAPAAVRSASVSAVRVLAEPGAAIGGAMAATVADRYYTTTPLSARIYGGTSLNPLMLASPAIENRDALGLLTEIAAATCRVWWWDEDGMLTWQPGDYLLARSPSVTLTSMDSLLDLGWSESLADTFSQVAVDHEVPSISASSHAGITVWQGRGETLEPGVPVEYVVAPDANEDWIQVDAAPVLPSLSTFDDINAGRRSVIGGAVATASTSFWANGGSRDYLDQSMSRIGPSAWKIRSVASTPPPGQSVQLRTLDRENADSGLWLRWRDQSLPIVRAKAKTEWVASTTMSAAAGNAAAGVYQHDAGRWVQGYAGEAPAALASFLATWLCTPRAKAESVKVIHDPRVQVGDVVRVRDEHAHGVELVALVTRIEQSVTAGGSDMALDLYVIAGESAWVTLGQHDASQAGTLSAHDVAQGGESLEQHDRDPVHRT